MTANLNGNSSCMTTKVDYQSRSNSRIFKLLLAGIAFSFSDFNGENNCAFLIRINHAYMDGLSTLQVIKKQLSTDKDPKPFIDILKYKLNGAVKLILYVNLIFKAPYYLLSALVQRACKTP